MASSTEERNEDDLVGRLDQRSAADLRRMEQQELRLAEATDLPMVRDKHRRAARRWGEMALDRERVEQRARARASGAPAGDGLAS